MKLFRFGSRLCPGIWLCNYLYSVNALLSGSFHLSIPRWVELMPRGRSLDCTGDLSHVGALCWRSMAVQEWQHPADLWCLHLAGEVAPAMAQRVVLRCPPVSEMSMELNHAAVLLTGGMDGAAWSTWKMLNGSVWHHSRRASLRLCPAQLWSL